jgi:hypothetical protein
MGLVAHKPQNGPQTGVVVLEGVAARARNVTGCPHHGGEGGMATVDDERQADMTDHNGVLMMQRLLLAGTLGLSLAQKAAAILDGEPARAESQAQAKAEAQAEAQAQAETDALPAMLTGQQAPDPRSRDGAVLRAILDAANECLGHFDDRPPGERWCDALLQVLDLAAFAADITAGAQLAG